MVGQTLKEWYSSKTQFTLTVIFSAITEDMFLTKNFFL